MNKKNIMLALVSAVLATGLAMSVLGTNAPVFAATSGSTQASSGNGVVGVTSLANANQAWSASAGGSVIAQCQLAVGCSAI
jgi:hypothetical protein